MKKQEKEQWKNVEGYDGAYQVSTLGRVRSLPRTVITSHGEERTLKGRILKHSLQSAGYPMVSIMKNGIRDSRTIHRLVAEAFITNDDPENKDKINHKNEDKTDNRVENLEWCTHSYNCRYNDVNIRRSKKVYQYTKDMQLVKIWNSATEAANKLKGVCKEGISLVCSKTRQTHGGYMWSFRRGEMSNSTLVGILKFAQELREEREIRELEKQVA